MKLPWSKGPKAPYLDAKRFRVYYRVRKWGELEWKVEVGEMVKQSESHVRREIARLGRGHNKEFEVMRVKEMPPEAPIQTGEAVKVVSQSEYEDIQRETQEKTEYERKELLREKGLIIP